MSSVLIYLINLCCALKVSRVGNIESLKLNVSIYKAEEYIAGSVEEINFYA